MKHKNLAQRYAKALLSLTEDASKSTKVAEELLALRELLESNEEFKTVFTVPGFEHNQRHQTVKLVLEKLGVETLTKNFVLLLLDKKRAQLFQSIQETFQQLLNEKRKQLHIRVVSAKELSEDYLKQLEEHFHKKTQQDIIMHKEIDPALIGGVKVWVGNTVYDGSVENRLAQLKENLVQQLA